MVRIKLKYSLLAGFSALILKRSMRPLHYYLLSTASWFYSWGIQSVIFTWLITIVLHTEPELVGFAQMAMLVPATLLMLVGGSLADYYGGKRVALLAQSCAAAGPLFLIVMISRDTLSYTSILFYAAGMGCVQAFLTPARDGLLNQVADGKIQRRVVQVSMIQFGIQMLGFLSASYADEVGAQIILGIQALVLITGVFALYRIQLPIPERTPRKHHLLKELGASIAVSFQIIRKSSAMRMIVVQNCAMGVFFMGTYIVSLPLLLREVYQGSSQELSWLNATNSMGLVIAITVLMRFGDIKRQGRALLLAQGMGAIVLVASGLFNSLTALNLDIFCWGLCGGVAMTMSRTIMQESAPPDMRGRMMAFFSFSFMGSGAIGALFSGFLVGQIGPANAIVISALCMLFTITLVGFRSGLWQHS